MAKVSTKTKSDIEMCIGWSPALALCDNPAKPKSGVGLLGPLKSLSFRRVEKTEDGSIVRVGCDSQLQVLSCSVNLGTVGI